jgi:DNA-binding transcriptional MerR regulator
MSVEEARLSIGDLAAATGVAVGTLRMWESRHGFPVAQRRGPGHRRYGAEEVTRVRRVLDERRQGLSLAAAIERVRNWPPSDPPSLFTVLRQSEPGHVPQRLPVAAMRAVSHAIEDECLARGGRPIVAGTFQRETAYRLVEPRWTELARTAALAFVLADFGRRRARRGSPAEIPLRRESPIHREWGVVAVGANFTACLVGWEIPTVSDGRRFEAVWTTDRVACGQALRAALSAAGGSLETRGAELLETTMPPAGGGSEWAITVANRAIGYLAGDDAHDALSFSRTARAGRGGS